MIKKARFLELSNKDYFPKSGKALDIGCHMGNESSELLKRGFEVDAIDIEKNNDIQDDKFHFSLCNVKDYKIEENTYDLILAYYVIPFLRDDNLIRETIKNIKSGLKDNGIAIITLFGKEHEWYKNGKGKHAHYTFEEAKEMIGEHIDLSTKEEMSNTMNGQRIFWQSWDFVIKK